MSKTDGTGVTVGQRLSEESIGLQTEVHGPQERTEEDSGRNAQKVVSKSLFEPTRHRNAEFACESKQQKAGRGSSCGQRVRRDGHWGQNRLVQTVSADVRQDYAQPQTHLIRANFEQQTYERNQETETEKQDPDLLCIPSSACIHWLHPLFFL